MFPVDHYQIPADRLVADKDGEQTRMFGAKNRQHIRVDLHGVRTEAVPLCRDLHDLVVLGELLLAKAGHLAELHVVSALNPLIYPANCAPAFRGKCVHDSLCSTRGQIDKDGLVIGQILQHAVGVLGLVGGVQTHEDNLLVPFLHLSQKEFAQLCLISWGGRFKPYRAIFGP